MIEARNTIKINVTITDEKGRELPNSLTNQEYNYLKYDQLLMIEKCLLEAFLKMNEIGQAALEEANSRGSSSIKKIG